MKQRILFIYEGKVCSLPPFMAILDSLSATNEYDITVISSDYEPEIDKLYEAKGINFIHYYKHDKSPNLLLRVYNKIRRELIFRKRVSYDLKHLTYDYLWIIHELTAVKIARSLKNRKYILSTYELRDDNIALLKKTQKITQHAKVNVVCEYNRGQIMRCWLKLLHSPIVLPNKPYNHPRSRNIPNPYFINNSKDKVILYQGIIARERNIDVLCDVISELDGYRLVLMGGKSPYLDEILAKYKKVEYIGYVRAPSHLMVTSHADIGIVTYSYDCLDTIYCAPNKIWEYSGFGIPMIGNEVPGLVSTIGKSKSGICVNTDERSEIRNAIKEIERNYVELSKNSRNFYESCNISDIIKNILIKYYQ